LLEALLKTRQEGDLPPAWLNYFPVDIARQLPDKLLCGFLETCVSSQSANSADLLTVVTERLAQPGSDALLASLKQSSYRSPTVTVAILGACRTANRVLLPKAIQELFPPLLKERHLEDEVARILDWLIVYPKLLDGNSLAALCLDNWTTLRANARFWPLLRQSHIEGSTLVGLANQWLSTPDRLHRIDMLVVILHDVRQRSRSSWLTPASLEFQALCAAGRYPEATRILIENPSLSIKEQSARSYMQSVQPLVPQRDGIYEAEFRQLWHLVISR